MMGEIKQDQLSKIECLVIRLILLVFLKYRWYWNYYSSLDTWVEESINVDDVLEETPLGLSSWALFGTKVSIDGGVNLGSHLKFGLGGHLNGLGLSSEEGDDGNGGVLEHLVINYYNKQSKLTNCKEIF